jgi:hypothetical protein
MPGDIPTDFDAWWFSPPDGRLAYGDGRPIVVGETLTVEPPIVLCKRGLHASVRAIHALYYAQSSTVCRVRLGGTIVHGGDKVAASQRTVLWMADPERVLRGWGAWCAMGALLGSSPVDQRSIDAVLLVQRYVDGEDISSAVWRAAESAARRATRRAASDAASDAARRAARSAAWSAARSAAWSAAESAAWSAAESAAWSAAWSAMNDELERRLLALGGDDGAA